MFDMSVMYDMGFFHPYLSVMYDMGIHNPHVYNSNKDRLL